MKSTTTKEITEDINRIETNDENSKSEFENLLMKTIEYLNKYLSINQAIIKDISGSRFEPLIFKTLEEVSKGTIFENEIKLIAGQKFPDIVIGETYGLEIKTTTKNHWKTTGNSVMESSRISTVKDIYIFFAKLASPVEFKFSKYEDVLSEVVVTHSPRYLIDMNLDSSKSIFSKIGIPYESLRLQSNPIKAIVNYYKSKVKSGEELWWMDDNSQGALTIRFYSNLSLKEKNELKIIFLALFPEILSNRNNKYNRSAFWLLKNRNIVCSNFRDIYSSGGKENIVFDGNEYIRSPKIIVHVLKEIEKIISFIIATDSSELADCWGIKTSQNTKITDWLNLVDENTNYINSSCNLDIKTILNNYLRKSV